MGWNVWKTKALVLYVYKLCCYVIQQECSIVPTCDWIEHSYFLKYAIIEAGQVQDLMEKTNNVLYVNNHVLLKV